MISRLRIRNFKRFLDQTFLFAPLTVLTGLNSSGKSTVVQSLLLAYQARLGVSRIVPLNCEPGLRLGQPTDVLATDAPTSRIQFDMTLNGAHGHWEFETQFEGAESASHLVCIKSSDIPISPTYLGAERMGPRTSQAISLTSTSRDEDTVILGDDGRFVAHALAVHGRRDVPMGLLNPGQTRVTTLLSQTEAWMAELVGPVQFDPHLVPRTDLATLHVRSSAATDWLLPTNVGFGITYALPIIVAGLTVRSEGVLIVDSPEAHLHPAAQSAVGRFLARVSGCGVQVLVETHSDHVLNGIRRAIVDEVVRSSDVTVHFLGEQNPVTIGINDRGRPSVWPPGFFDQMEVDLRSITQPRGHLT